MSPVYLNDQDLNEVIVDYLQDELYQYALMLDGSWGCGKTYFVKNILELPMGCSRVYVSLYGIPSVQALREAHMDAMLRSCIDGLEIPVIKGIREMIGFFGTPVLSKLVLEKIPIFGESDEKSFRDFLSGSLRKMMDRMGEQAGKSQRFLYIFDDLERCCIPVVEVLGYLNSLVESSGCKVLLIANEAECRKMLRDSRDENLYDRTCEKLIGRKILYSPGTQGVVRKIVNRVREKRNLPWDDLFADRLSQRCEQAMQDEQVWNFRILQFSLSCFARIFDAVKEIPGNSKFKENALLDIMNATLRVSIRSRTNAKGLHWDIQWKSKEEEGNVDCLSEEGRKAWYQERSNRKTEKSRISPQEVWFHSFKFVHSFVQTGVLDENKARSVFSDVIKSGCNEQDLDSPLHRMMNSKFYNQTDFQATYMEVERSFLKDQYNISQMSAILRQIIYIKLKYNLSFVDPDRLVNHLISKTRKGERVAEHLVHIQERTEKEPEPCRAQADDEFKIYKNQIRNEQDQVEVTKLINKLLEFQKAFFCEFSLDEREKELIRRKRGFIKFLDIEKLLDTLNQHRGDGRVFAQLTDVFYMVYHDGLEADEQELKSIEELIGAIRNMDIQDCFVAKYRDEFIETLRGTHRKNAEKK